MEQDSRRLRRRHLIFYLEVRDHRTGDYLGHLVDLTTKGIKLISKDPIAVNDARTLRMELPEDFGTDPSLVFEARAVWSAKDVNPDFYDTGFELINLPPQAASYLQNLIDEMGFND